MVFSVLSLSLCLSLSTSLSLSTVPQYPSLSLSLSLSLSHLLRADGYKVKAHQSVQVTARDLKALDAESTSDATEHVSLLQEHSELREKYEAAQRKIADLEAKVKECTIMRSEEKESAKAQNEVEKASVKEVEATKAAVSEGSKANATESPAPECIFLGKMPHFADVDLNKNGVVDLDEAVAFAKKVCLADQMARQIFLKTGLDKDTMMDQSEFQKLVHEMGGEDGDLKNEQPVDTEQSLISHAFEQTTKTNMDGTTLPQTEAERQAVQAGYACASKLAFKSPLTEQCYKLYQEGSSPELNTILFQHMTKSTKWKDLKDEKTNLERWWRTGYAEYWKFDHEYIQKTQKLKR